jgi:Zn-dependent metalloprotease
VRSKSALTRAIVAAATFLASTAFGAADEVVERGAVPFPHGAPVRIGDTARQTALERGAAWQDFRKRNGDWSALWNEATGTPHRAFGRAIPLAGFRDDAGSVDQAVRRFIRENTALFGDGVTLATASVQRSDRLWYVRYRQTVNGVPVLFSDWEFRVGVNGNLAAFGVDGHPAAVARTTAALVAPVAREAAKSGLDFDPATDRVDGGKELYLLPYPNGGALDYRLVYEVTVRTREPLGNWLTYVDASTGEVLYRRNRVRTAISGNVSALVNPLLPTDTPASRPLPHLSVTVGANTVVTDAAGNYSAPAPGSTTVSAQLRGQYCDVNRQDAGDASFSTPAANGSTVNIIWGTNAAADIAERDAYYHVNVVHDYIKGIDSTPILLDNPMPCAVNINDVCNAYWDGVGVNFFAAGGGCVNTGTMADVIYHEYGHGINDFTYIAHGAGSGMGNGALHEGLADVNAAFLTDDPVIGDGFTGPGTSLRTISNTNRWPENRSGDPHTTGLIVAGACWDLRQSVGLALARTLSQRAKWGTPDDPDDGVAFSEYFLDILTADDDDANLANGTPHGTQIVNAFNAHGIGTGLFLHIVHTPVTDRPFISVGSVPVTATITYNGPIGALDASSPRLRYQVNRGAFVAVTMTPTGNPNEFSASIPVSQMNVYHYYLTAGDNMGGTVVSPFGAPAAPTNAFLVGYAVAFFDEQMESNPGWTIGAPGDSATTGVWVRVDPVGTFNGSIPVQPEDDHTPGTGVLCFVTGNALVGDPPGTNDVDGGATTLVTKTMAPVAGFSHTTVDFYRTFSNDQGGAPGTDTWRVDISNNGGGTWVAVESTLVSHADWARVLFRVEDYVAPTSNLKLRFIAADKGAGSLIEAAVDDFRLLGFNVIDAVDGGPIATASMSLAPAAPNPFQPSTRFAFSLPVEAPVRLSIYDVRGRLIRDLVNGVQPAGEHSIRWDGLDRAGHQVPSGPYFARLSQNGKEITKTVVRLE